MITAVAIGVVALVLSDLMRLQIGFPGRVGFITPEAYYQFITMHGMIMVIYLLTALFLGGFGKHAREGAKAAARKRRGTNGMSIGCRSEKKDRSRPGGPRAQNIAEDSARRNYRAQQLRLKKLGDKIRNRHGRPSEKIEDAFFA